MSIRKQINDGKSEHTKVIKSILVEIEKIRGEIFDAGFTDKCDIGLFEKLGIIYSLLIVEIGGEEELSDNSEYN